MGRLLSDILTENGLIAHLREANLLGELEPICGKTMTGKNLLKRKIIDKLLVEPSPCLSTIVKKRIPIADFPMFNSGEHSRMVLHYLETYRET